MLPEPPLQTSGNAAPTLAVVCAPEPQLLAPPLLLPQPASA
jgi:hypothetical protein